jgi:polyferredoxin
LRKEVLKNARRMIFFLSWLALMLIFLSTYPALGSYEPFSMMFSLSGMGIQWYILPLSLFGSFLIPQFWCRLFCPVGLYLTELVRIRRKASDLLSGVKDKLTRKRNSPCDRDNGIQPISVQEYQPPANSQEKE